jgi:hypothetical protein
VAISEIQMPDGRTYRFEDVGDYMAYSTMDFQGGCTDSEIVVFNYTEGGDVSGSTQTTTAPNRTATKHDTNLITAGTMSDDEAMSVFSTRIFVAESTVTDNGDPDDGSQTFTRPQPIPSMENLARLNLKLVFELRVMGDKPFEQHWVGWFNPGWGPIGFVQGGTISVGSFGESGHDHARRLAVPVMIPPTQVFQGVFINPTGQAVTLVTPAAAESANVQLRVNTTLVGPRQRDVGRAQAMKNPIVRRLDVTVVQ